MSKEEQMNKMATPEQILKLHAIDLSYFKAAGDLRADIRHDAEGIKAFSDGMVKLQDERFNALKAFFKDLIEEEEIEDFERALDASEGRERELLADLLGEGE